MITTSEGLGLEVVNLYKYLGVWLDGTLSFSQLISKLQAKIKSRLGFLYCNRSSFIPAAKLTLIQMTVLSMLDYGEVIYRSAGKGAHDRLDVLYHYCRHRAPPFHHDWTADVIARCGLNRLFCYDITKNHLLAPTR